MSQHTPLSSSRRALYVVVAVIGVVVANYLLGRESSPTPDCTVRKRVTVTSPDNLREAFVATRECNKGILPSGLFVFMQSVEVGAEPYELVRSPVPAREISLSWIDRRKLQIEMHGYLTEEEQHYGVHVFDGIFVSIVTK